MAAERRVIRATRADIESDAKAIVEVTVVKTDNQVATLELLEKPIAEYMASRLDAACPRAAIEPNLFMVRWSARMKIFTVSLPEMLQDYILDAGIFKIEPLGSKYAMKPIMADEPTKSGEGKQGQHYLLGHPGHRNQRNGTHLSHPQHG